MPVMRQHQQSHTPQEQETAALESQETPQGQQQQQSSQGAIPPVSAATTPQPQTQSASDRAFGADFSDVQVHGGGDAAIGAQAFAGGNDIHLGGAEGGDGHVAHEAAHTVQQRAEEAEQEEEEKQRG